jgi:hypothetical protein
MSTAPWPRASRLILEETHIWDQLKNERPTSNIERPTSNNVFHQFKKRLSEPTPPKWLQRPGANLLFETLRFACYKIDKA